MRLSCHLTLALTFLFGACGDEKAQTGRPIGAVCDADGDCGVGACLQGQCLDPEADEDGDGLVNRIEASLGTSITSADTDGDALSDRNEVSAELTAVDSDGDGIQDALESDIADADGDCLPDQRDADVTTRADLLARICKSEGVCAAGTLAVACAKTTATCDYAGISAFEATEVSCDDLDNDCDGATDEDLPPGACVPVLVGFALDSEAATLTIGETLALVATATYDRGSPLAVTATAGWTSTAPAIATVSAGVVTALAPGVTDIVATLGDLSATATLTVVAAPVVLETLDVLPANPSAALGRAIAFSVVGHYSDDSSAPVTAGITWKSSNGNVVVGANGVAETIATGTAKVTATVDGLEGSTTVTVTPAVPVSFAIAIATDSPRVAFDGTHQLRAIAALTDGNEVDFSDKVDWSSSAPEVATVDSDGLVTGHVPGDVDITADLAGVFAVVPLEVVVALMPFVASHVPARTVALGATSLAGAGAIATVSSSSTARTIRVDAGTSLSGPNAPNVIVARPSARVDHE